MIWLVQFSSLIQRNEQKELSDESMICPGPKRGSSLPVNESPALL